MRAPYIKLPQSGGTIIQLHHSFYGRFPSIPSLQTSLHFISISSTTMPSMQLTLLALLGAANAANHAIVVGPSLKFHPSSVSAAEGDTVSFQIHEDHNVQQGTFSSPCQDMSGGFSSGGSFHGASVNPNLFIVTINSTDPIFGYCGEEGHCQAGMTFGINVP